MPLQDDEPVSVAAEVPDDRREGRRRRISRCQQAGCTADTADPARLALLVWSALHGQATLCIDRPHGPWPPLEETIPDLMTRLLRLGEAGSPGEWDDRDT